MANRSPAQGGGQQWQPCSGKGPLYMSEKEGECQQKLRCHRVAACWQSSPSIHSKFLEYQNQLPFRIPHWACVPLPHMAKIAVVTSRTCTAARIGHLGTPDYVPDGQKDRTKVEEPGSQPQCNKRQWATRAPTPLPCEYHHKASTEDTPEGSGYQYRVAQTTPLKTKLPLQH